MNWMEILQPALQMILTAIIGLLASILVAAVNTKRQEILERIKDEKAKKYVDLIADTITKCVMATNQTYVESMKDKDIFDEEAHKEAFKRTYDAVLDILNGDAVEYIEEVYGDIQGYLTNAIEAEVNSQKWGE